VGKWDRAAVGTKVARQAKRRQAGKWMGYNCRLRGKRNGETLAIRSQEGVGKARVESR